MSFLKMFKNYFWHIIVVKYLIFIHLVQSQFYINDGVFKFIAGIGLPVDVNLPEGSLSWFTNVQVFYKLPDNITYYEPYKIMEKRSLKNTVNRYTVYQALEKYFERIGVSGKECIYLLICEIAQRKVNRSSNGLLGEIIHTVFTPSKDSDQHLKKHKSAFRHGLVNNTDCENIYRECLIKDDSILFNII